MEGVWRTNIFDAHRHTRDLVHACADWDIFCHTDANAEPHIHNRRVANFAGRDCNTRDSDSRTDKHSCSGIANCGSTTHRDVYRDSARASDHPKCDAKHRRGKYNRSADGDRLRFSDWSRCEF